MHIYRRNRKRFDSRHDTGISRIRKNQFGYKEKRFRSFDSMGGEYYYENEGGKKYVGMYHEPIYITTEKDAVHWRVEFQQVVETTYLKLPDTVENGLFR